MRRWLSYIIAAAAGLLIMIFSVFIQDLELESAADWMRLLSNAALVPGVLMCGFGIMALIAGEGIFDGLKYTVSSMWTHVRGGKKKYDSYYEYSKRSRKEQSVGFLLVPGAAYLAMALGFMAMYYMV